MSKSQQASKDMHIPPSLYVNARSSSEQHDTTTKDLLNKRLLKVNSLSEVIAMKRQPLIQNPRL